MSRTFDISRRTLESLEEKSCLASFGFATLDVQAVEHGSATDLALLDVDGNGDLDVVIRSNSSNTVGWYRNLGDGAFSRQEAIVVGESVSSIAFGDIDGDGDLDAAATVRRDGTSWYENRGNGFVRRSFVEAFSGSTVVGLSDQDRDGRVDLVMIDRENGIVSWHQNEGINGPEFASVTVMETFEPAFNERVVIEDIDGDGDDDALLIAGTSISWLDNVAGDGSSYISNPLSYTAFGLVSADFADFNSDGRPDLVVHDSDGTTSWLKNNGASFGSAVRIASGMDLVWPSFSDLDMDGDLDIIGTSTFSNSVVWFANVNNGQSFSKRAAIATLTGGSTVSATDDMDGDSVPDVLVASDRGQLLGELNWFQNLNSAQSFAANKISSSNTGGAFASFAEDVDGDGDLDIISAAAFYSYSGNRVFWFENLDGQGQFSQQIDIDTELRGLAAILPIDIDGDGDIDLISTQTYGYEPSSGRLVWYENIDGKGDFVEVVIFADLPFGDLQIADLDGDFRPDIVVVDNRGIGVYSNLPGGFLKVQTLVPSSVGARGIQLGDLDNDGDLDLVSAGSGVSWFKNQGNGEFLADELNLIASEPQVRFQRPIVTDLNGDTHTDVLIANDNEVFFINGRGDASFSIDTAATFFDAFIQSVAASDIDRNGETEIVVATDLDVSIRSIETIDEAEFGISIASKSDSIRSVTFADIDGDGDLDLLTAAFNDGRISWHQQRPVGDANNDGVFSSSDLVQLFQAGEYEDDILGNSSFEEGDWDGDNDFTSSDLVFALRDGAYSVGIAPSVRETTRFVDHSGEASYSLRDSGRMSQYFIDCLVDSLDIVDRLGHKKACSNSGRR